ncbi:hypothetical protein C900_05955 [Fulvivirga imtechensis AK7]|uniref:DUF3788 domain-containing protein n=1 Tax=Fulvivirga imtechensis AK7 TaxID=1237149 RepID=L8JIG0_9BACT|nr:DUF3788 domain-containing protein [Fulvivirga imtechensis]ELR68666.1 hypothetical protein C900_05955 [Fulvivirga imtechensis AK7]
MDDISVFTDKTIIPDEETLSSGIGDTYPLWNDIKSYVYEHYPKATEEWKYPGAKYGWSFRVKDKKRVIIYLLPRENYFLAAMVFSPKATEMVLESPITDIIKDELRAARPYAEGRGIRIPVKNQKDVKDIKLLIDIKLAH